MKFLPLRKLLIIFIIVISGLTYSQVKYPNIVKNKINSSVAPFDLTEVKLLDSSFKKAMDLDEKYLLSLAPDRLLSWFRKEAGLEPKGEVYGGWESDQVAGHTLGHYLSACSMMYASTGNKKLLDRINYIVDELDACQSANGNGYLGAIPGGKQLFKEISERNIISEETSGFRLNGIWSPWYTIHKMFAGLLDVQKYCDNKKALEIAKKFGAWAWNTTKNLARDEFQKMLICEYGGMNETMAELYARTGDKKYLELAEEFFDNKVLLPIINHSDSLNGLHSNTQIPKIIGLLRIYELTGKDNYLSAAKFFWNIVVKHHSYVIGGNSENEYFGKADNLSARLDSNTCETCNTYNMLKLTRELYKLDPKESYIEFYERALYNHILASQNPETGMMCYFVPLEAGAFKTFSTPFNDFWCCVGSGMENHSKYGRNIYFHNNDSLIVNLFIPSKVYWNEKGISITQQTDFPNSGKSKFIINCGTPEEFSFLIRYPAWSDENLNVSINGKKQSIANNPGSYITLNRKWENGDIIEIDLSPSLHLETMKDDPKKAVILYGPIVLAGLLGPENDLKAEQPDYVPYLVVKDRKINQWISRLPGSENEFHTIKAGRPRDIILRPFYLVHNYRYNVYWNFLTYEEWQEKQKKIRNEISAYKNLMHTSVDFVHPGIEESENVHNFKGEKSNAGEEARNKWRVANYGGWMSFDLKINSNDPVKLVCRYSGSVKKEREFDIYVDDEKVASQTLNKDNPGGFIDVTYKLDEKLTKGKDKITVKFVALSGGVAGGVFGIWTTK